MPTTPAANLQPLTPIIGRWHTSGTVLDANGNISMSIAGTDTYEVLPGGHWIAHDVDVRIGDERTLLHELIGGVHADGGWQMHAFSADDGPELMRLTHEEPELLLLHGDGVRSWFRINASNNFMTTLWEQQIDGRWLPWMDEVRPPVST